MPSNNWHTGPSLRPHDPPIHAAEVVESVDTERPKRAAVFVCAFILPTQWRARFQASRPTSRLSPRTCSASKTSRTLAPRRCILPRQATHDGVAIARKNPTGCSLRARYLVKLLLRVFLSPSHVSEHRPRRRYHPLSQLLLPHHVRTDAPLARLLSPHGRLYWSVYVCVFRAPLQSMDTTNPAGIDTPPRRKRYCTGISPHEAPVDCERRTALRPVGTVPSDAAREMANTSAPQCEGARQKYKKAGEVSARAAGCRRFVGTGPAGPVSSTSCESSSCNETAVARLARAPSN
jgi:hypothetical protein